jgi:hypothetical protein
MRSCRRRRGRWGEGEMGSSPLTYDVKNVITGENEVLKIEIKY